MMILGTPKPVHARQTSSVIDMDNDGQTDIGQIGIGGPSSSYSSSSNQGITLHQHERCKPCYSSSNDDDGSSEPITLEGQCDILTKRSPRFLANTEQCYKSQLENYQADCCEIPPENYCTLCSDKSYSFDSNKLIPSFNPYGPDSEDEPNLTCGDLMNTENNDVYLEYIFNSGECSDTLLGRSAAWCGCRNTYQECTLCSDGVSRPQFMNRIDTVYYGWNCEAFEYVASMFNSEECTRLSSEILEFDAESFCGCPGAQPPNICQLCDDEEYVYDSELIANEESQLTCGELDISTSYIPTIGPCNKVRNSYYEDGTLSKCCRKKERPQSQLLQFTTHRKGMAMIYTGVGVIVCFMVAMCLLFDRYFYRCFLWCCCLCYNNNKTNHKRNENDSEEHALRASILC